MWGRIGRTPPGVHASAEEGEPLHLHLSHLDINIHNIQHLLSIGDSQDLEFHIPEVDRVKGVVLPSDDDGSLVGWDADFEAYTFVREEDELGGVSYLQHLRVIEKQCGYF